MKKQLALLAFSLIGSSAMAMDLNLQLKEWEVGVAAGTGSLNIEENASTNGFTLSGGKNFQITDSIRTTSILMYNKQNLSVEDGDGGASEFGISQRVSYTVAEMSGIVIRPFGEIGYASGSANINISKSIRNDNYMGGYGHNGHNGYINNGYDSKSTRKIDHDMDYSKVIMAIGTEVDFGGGLLAIAKYDFSRGSYSGKTKDNKDELDMNSFYYGNDRDENSSNSGDLSNGIFSVGLAYRF